MQPYTRITRDIRQKIIDAVGVGAVLPENQWAPYHHDASELHAGPELVILAEERSQVEKLLALTNRYRFAVTPRGGGSGLAGGCVALQGGVVLSLERMNRILSVDTTNLIAEVEPGVVTRDLRNAAEAAGLFYPPDPAGLDQSTIGGNVATNAGGPACVKYGTTKDYVLGLEAVLPTGQWVRAGVKTRKGVVGYDLAQLLIGSEGTLGIITALTLKLIPHPPAVGNLTAVFSDLPTAMQAVTAVMGRGHLPSAIEFMDHKCLELLGDLLPFPVPGEQASLLIIETDGAADQIGAEIGKIAAICRETGARELLPAADEAERARIWEVRRQISLRIHDHAALYISEDVAVPIGRIADLVAELPAFEARYGLFIYAFGHAGDGNIHLNVTAADREHLPRVERGITALPRLVLEMGGTISGEHGIGEAKKRFLPLELSPESIRLQQGIKRLFDPRLILNPGKIFPDAG